MKNDDGKPKTIDVWIPVASDEHSLTVGRDGPILPRDHSFIEQMANFNRERIPERQPHVTGSGTFATWTRKSATASIEFQSVTVEHGRQSGFIIFG